jgi:GTPase SAR1 family protein
LKVLLIGDSGVGKSSLLLRFTVEDGLQFTADFPKDNTFSDGNVNVGEDFV